MFYFRFYILCENFSKIGPIIKKIPKFQSDPLKRVNRIATCKRVNRKLLKKIDYRLIKIVNRKLVRKSKSLLVKLI